MTKPDQIVWTSAKRTVESLAPWARNPRKITDKRMAKLQTSLARYGYAATIIVNLDGRIIAGHMRLKAMILLKMVKPEDEVDVRIPNRMLMKQEAEDLAVLDNAKFGEWDFDILGADFEIPRLLDLGFEPIELGIEAPNLGDDDKKNKGPALQYNIVFENESQQDRWQVFIGRLKDNFPDYDTLASRLDAYLKETVGLT